VLNIFNIFLFIPVDFLTGQVLNIKKRALINLNNVYPFRLGRNKKFYELLRAT